MIDFKRCVPPRPNLSRTSAVPPLSLSGTSLSISGPSVRPLPVPEGVHQGSGGCLGTPSEEGFKDYALPRRLARICPIPPAGCGGYRVSTVPHSVSRLPGQLGKERPESKTGNILFGTLPELSHDEGISHPSESSRDPGNPSCRRQNRRIELLYFQRMLGLMSAAAMVIPLGLLRARPLQCWLNISAFTHGGTGTESSG